MSLRVPRSPSKKISDQDVIKQAQLGGGGMRRVKRFLNLEQRSGRLSSSRGTSPDCTNSSQMSDAFQFMMKIETSGDGKVSKNGKSAFGPTNI